MVPEFSIITVVKNDPSGLQKTAESVLKQSFCNFEYIVIDGKSTDATVDELKKISKHAICLSEPDLGISDAFNKGLKVSQGRWINFLNAGDVFAGTTTLAEVADVICQHESYKVFSGFARFGNKTIPKRPFKNAEPIHIKAMLSHQASFIERDIFDEVGLFDLDFKIRMDYDLWIRILRKYEFYLVEDIWVVYDLDGISSNKDNLRLFFEEGMYANKKNLIKNFKRVNAIVDIQRLKARCKFFILELFNRI